MQQAAPQLAAFDSDGGPRILNGTVVAEDYRRTAERMPPPTRPLETLLENPLEIRPSILTDRVNDRELSSTQH
ncbi:hypothetical protein [Streptomyces sp. Agncl-13]|uniref:hypothetical protein n=1 Tax=Streptomyces sp. Agncl-13 TaxID=3400628 RepID=UPI003A86FCFB